MSCVTDHFSIQYDADPLLKLKKKNQNDPSDFMAWEGNTIFFF